MLAHKWGTILRRGNDGLGPSPRGSLCPHRAESILGGGAGWASPSHKGDLGCNPENFGGKTAFKMLPSSAMNVEKLVSVGVQHGAVKREKLVLHRRWLVCRGTAGV